MQQRIGEVSTITESMQFTSGLCAEKGLFHIVDLELVPVARAASGMDRSRLQLGKLQQGAKVYVLRGSWIKMYTLRAEYGLSCSCRGLDLSMSCDMLDRS